MPVEKPKQTLLIILLQRISGIMQTVFEGAGFKFALVVWDDDDEETVAFLANCEEDRVNAEVTRCLLAEKHHRQLSELDPDKIPVAS